MTLKKLDIHHCRNITKASIYPSPFLNLITGENASGKTSLLEAIYILARAKSFRTSHIKNVIQVDHQQITVVGQLNESNRDIKHIGVQLDNHEIIIRIDKENANKSELSYSFPVLIIHPKSYILIDGGPKQRREFIDWGVFFFNEQFLSVWRKYKKALQQRNCLLKAKQLIQINVWNNELAEYGEQVSSYRKKYIDKLKPIFSDICKQFINVDKVDLIYYRGWDSNQSLLNVLTDAISKDVKYGYTSHGPQRCDFLVLINDKPAKEFCSRGQLKLLMLALKLAQLELAKTTNLNPVCVLIDDLAAELDISNKFKLLNFLHDLRCQVFISATEVEDLGDLTHFSDIKMFHVKHGDISASQI